MTQMAGNSTMMPQAMPYQMQEMPAVEPQTTPVNFNVNATVMPTANTASKVQDTTPMTATTDTPKKQTTYKQMTYVEAEMPYARAPYQMDRPANPTCKNLPLATSYVQPQKYENLTNYETVVDKGTFFNDLYQPYKGGRR